MTKGETGALGIALDGTSLTAAWRRASTEWSETSITCDATTGSIARTLATLTDEVPAPRDVRVTLLRPLAQTRTVELPRSSRTQIERVLERDWTRYIVGFRATPHTAAARRVATNRWSVAFAPTDVLEAILISCRELGWPAPLIQTADVVLASIIRERGESGSEPACAIVCDDTGATDGVIARGSEPWVGRRFFPNAGAHDVQEFAWDGLRYAGPTESQMPIVLLGAATTITEVAAKLNPTDFRVRMLPVNVRDAPAAFAATGTLAQPILRLLPPGAVRERARHARKLTAWLVAASIMVLVTGLGVERAGIRRQLEAIQRTRADIGTPVQQALGSRAALESSVEAATALAAHERSRAGTSSLLAAIVTVLPPGTALTILAISGDSVTVEGESARGAAVYDAIRRVKGISSVRLSAPLRQERAVGDISVEHFAFTARSQSPAQ